MHFFYFIAGCPRRGWRKFKDFCYLIVEQELNWNGALKYCHKQGADLARIDNEAEHNFIFSQIPKGLYVFVIRLVVLLLCTFPVVL